MLNVIALWNATRIQGAAARLDAEGHRPEPDLARVMPLLHRHITLFGRHGFTLPKGRADGTSRPLREPRSEQGFRTARCQYAFRSHAPSVMRTTLCRPVIQTADVTGTIASHRRRLGLRALFDTDWYVGLRNEADGTAVLADLRYDHETMPPVGRGETRGPILDFEV